MTLWEIFKEGGFIMWPLLIFSIASWCVIVEKFLTITKFEKLSLGLFDEVQKLAKDKDVSKARDLCLQVGSPLISNPVLAFIDGEDVAGEKKIARIERRIQETNRGLRRYLWVLGTVATSAPFIGLFGTVVGIMRSFDAIATAGKGGFSIVAAGISEALIATAAGILVAVIAVIFFNYFQTRLQGSMSVYRSKLDDLSDYL